MRQHDVLPRRKDADARAQSGFGAWQLLHRERNGVQRQVKTASRVRRAQARLCGRDARAPREAKAIFAIFSPPYLHAPFENARAYPRIQPRHRLNAGEVRGDDERSLLGRLEVEQVFVHNERAAVDGAA